MVRIMLTEANAALAGVPSIASFMTPIASMATFNEERATSRRFGRLDSGSMVEEAARKVVRHG